MAVLTAMLGIIALPATAWGAPAVTAGAATQNGAGGATLPGTVNPNGQATTWYIEYGPTTAYGTASAAASAGSGAAAVPVSIPAPGLAWNSTVHWRVVATDDLGATTHGADQSFVVTDTVAPSVPAVSGGSASWLSIPSTTFTASGATDAFSGVAGYQYQTSSNGGASWGTTFTGPAVTITFEGNYAARFRAVDNAGNAGAWSTVAAASMSKLDRTGPSTPTPSGGSNAWWDAPHTSTITGSGAFDAASGVAGTSTRPRRTAGRRGRRRRRVPRTCRRWARRWRASGRMTTPATAAGGVPRRARTGWTPPASRRRARPAAHVDAHEPQRRRRADGRRDHALRLRHDGQARRVPGDGLQLRRASPGRHQRVVGAVEVVAHPCRHVPGGQGQRGHGGQLLQAQAQHLVVAPAPGAHAQRDVRQADGEPRGARRDRADGRGVEHGHQQRHPRQRRGRRVEQRGTDQRQDPVQQHLRHADGHALGAPRRPHDARGVPQDVEGGQHQHDRHRVPGRHHVAVRRVHGDQGREDQRQDHAHKAQASCQGLVAHLEAVSVAAALRHRPRAVNARARRGGAHLTVGLVVARPARFPDLRWVFPTPVSAFPSPM